jgi:urea transporter
MSIKKSIAPIFEGVVNSYSILFFSNSKIFSLLLLLISFFNPVAGLSGLIAAFATVCMALLMGFNQSNTVSGVYSFNALLFGIGFGSFFESSVVFYFFTPYFSDIS